MNEEICVELKAKRVNNETANKLYNMLKEIWDNEEFALGVIGGCTTEEKQQKMINAITDGLTDTDEITIYSLALEADTDVATFKKEYDIDW
ncbi:MAG: hypothetical protein LUG16_06345 [Candidatus Gastranaerophilales bacterium]|nr:hypothetical protein [Candidatus Gastranaerophilales bacterium]